MSRLPLIVGFGGYNAAGRSSFHHGFKRCIENSLPASERQTTLLGLAVLMGLLKAEAEHYLDRDGQRLTAEQALSRYQDAVLNGSLIRRLEPSLVDPDACPWQKNLTLNGPAGKPLVFITQRKQLPEPLPSDWIVESLGDQEVQVTLYDGCDIKVDSLRELPVKSAGQLPTGFNPADYYNARFHPRGLQLAILGASDALHSTGIDWQRIKNAVAPDEIAVYSGSVMSQIDEHGYGGLLQARLTGGRVTAKQLPLGLNTMPADFINAYVLGSVGQTGSVTGACATFLYNLQKAVEGIQSGRVRVALVGNSEAPLTSECIDGYAAMSALATEDGLRQVQERAGQSGPVDFRRASRPFGDNCGFTLAEASQYVLLMDDELALELGADIHGAVPDVFINADGFKKSISAPGPGNYLTLAKALASTAALVGLETVRQHSFVHAHGSSTPANRVTESELLNRIAQSFAIERWPVTAIKSYVGHSLAAASADQLIAALGSFATGILPGIKTLDSVAGDVARSHLEILTQDSHRSLHIAFLNSKGFGGNNASAALLSAALTEQLLAQRHGRERLSRWQALREHTRQQAQAYDQQALKGELKVLYQFGEGLIDEHELAISSHSIRVPGFAQAIELTANPGYADLALKKNST